MMEIEKKNLQVENNTNERDDSKDIITIDYFDRINNKWIKVEVTKEVARFMKIDEQRTRRKQNQYNYYNIPFDRVFANGRNQEYLLDPNAEIDLDKSERELMREKENEQRRTIVENSLSKLTPNQLEVVEKTFYENKGQSEIAKELGISQQSVSERLKKSKEKIRNHIKNTEN